MIREMLHALSVLDHSPREIRAENITYDPQQAIRDDYKQLAAHYDMVMQAGNKLLRDAQAKSAQAHECFDEAQLIHSQIEMLERLHPELEAA